MMARMPSSLLVKLKTIPDPRRRGGNLRHQLVDVIVMGFIGVLAGCNDFVEIVEYAHAKRNLFEKFLSLPNGIPSVDTFERIYARLDPQALQRALIDWLREVHQVASHAAAEATGPDPKHIAIDGKTLRRTFSPKHGLGAMILVSAWSTQEGITLGQVPTDSKSNEIKAIPPLLDLLALEGAVVTVDAAGCQKVVAAKIKEKKGDYLLALKENHPTMYQQVSEYFIAQGDRARPARGFREVQSATKSGHGRLEKRTVQVAPIPRHFQRIDEWAGLRSIVMVCRETTDPRTGEEKGEVRYFLSSLPPRAKQAGRLIRAHWSIENSLHYSLDVTFQEDRSRHRSNTHCPENIALMNRIALSLIKNERGTKGSIKCKRKRAGWRDDYLFQLLSLGT